MSLQHALGGVVLESAFLERVLRAAFSALIDSKYAAVVDSRLTAATMIEDCERITRHHTDIPGAEKEQAAGSAQGLPPGELASQPGDPRRVGNAAG